MAVPDPQPAQPAPRAAAANGATAPTNGEAALDHGAGTTSHTNGDSHAPIDVTCGPLLNYRHTTGANDGRPVWHGSVLIVARPGATATPRLRYRESSAGVLLPDEHATHSANNGAPNGTSNGVPNGAKGANGASESAEWRTAEGLKLFADPRKTFWRFDLDVALGARETRWEYSLPDVRLPSGGPTRSFVVPAASESMRIMFHSCNGFSVGTDEDAWSGCALWADVLRMHAQKPVHVMIGGGDQIYNDGVRVEGPLREWTDIGNPHKRREYSFGEKLRAECDEYYFKNYEEWYSTEPFATANAQIPQLNIWDDHGTQVYPS